MVGQEEEGDQALGEIALFTSQAHKKIYRLRRSNAFAMGGGLCVISPHVRD
jgi:hypothetical protein